MTDFQSIGKEAILEAANHQLDRMRKAEQVILTNTYGSPDLFEIALRMIGEESLAQEFVDPNPDTESIIKRESSEESILTAILNNLERGNVNEARRLEDSQRRLFYLKDAGYVDAHFRPIMKPFGKRKEKLRLGILEKGLGGEYYEHPDYGRVSCGKISFNESIYALFVNLALGRTKHAKRVLQDCFNVHFNQETGLVSTYYCMRRKSWGATANLLRVARIMQDPRAEDSEQIEKLMEEYRKSMLKEEEQKSYYDLLNKDVVALALCLDVFNDSRNLTVLKDDLVERVNKDRNVRERELARKEKDAKKFGENPDEYASFGHHPGYYNAKLMRDGLALVGLERDKPNWFYAP